MRPDLLNPLFAEIAALKGVGPALAKPLERLGLSRVVDVLFHLPTGSVTRHRVERLYPHARTSGAKRLRCVGSLLLTSEKG